MGCARFAVYAVYLLVFSSPIACEGEALEELRDDLGVSRPDAGVLAGLPLLPGDRFTFQGTLTARDESATDDLSATYTLEVTIETVEDGGATAESRLTFTAAGENNFNRGWTDVYDFSSWVGRLGPSLTGDQVSNLEIEVGLGDIPELPSRGPLKVLPAGNLFVDLRRFEALRDRFADEHQDHEPRVVEADANNGFARFEYKVMDPTIITYNVQTRAVVMEFDARGVIHRLEERIGEDEQPPFAVTSLERVL